MQPAGVVDELEAELAFEAGLAVIGGGVDLRHYPDQRTVAIVLDVHLAAHRAEGADRPFHLPGFVPFVVPFDQGAYRTDIDTGAAKFAARLQQGCPEGRAHQRLSTAHRKRDGVVTTQLLTGIDAASADDT